MKSRFYKILSVLSNVLLVLVIAFWFFKRAPRIYEAYQLESKVAPIFNLLDLNSLPVQQPQEGKKVAFVFWATWCGPCQVELARINQLVKDHSIPEDSVVAISYGEDPKLVMSEAQKRGYLFQLVQDFQGEASAYFKVVGTPTVVLLDEHRKVKWVTSGISPTLEARLRGFF